MKYKEKIDIISEKINKGERVPIKDYAMYLRANQTYAEMKLFSVILKNLPIRFKRQGIVGNIFIADFVCQKLKLIIEIDGSIHNDIKVYQKDIVRQKILEEWGYKVIRISEQEIHENIDGVIDFIFKNIRAIMNFNNFDKDYIDFVCNYDNLK